MLLITLYILNKYNVAYIIDIAPPTRSLPPDGHAH